MSMAFSRVIKETPAALGRLDGGLQQRGYRPRACVYFSTGPDGLQDIIKDSEDCEEDRKCEMTVVMDYTTVTKKGKRKVKHDIH